MKWSLLPCTPLVESVACHICRFFSYHFLHFFFLRDCSISIRRSGSENSLPNSCLLSISLVNPANTAFFFLHFWMMNTRILRCQLLELYCIFLFTIQNDCNCHEPRLNPGCGSSERISLSYQEHSVAHLQLPLDCMCKYITDNPLSNFPSWLTK